MKKFPLKSTVLTLCFAGVISTPLLASTTDSEKVEKLTRRTEKLENKLENLTNKLSHMQSRAEAQHERILREERAAHRRLRAEETKQHQRLTREERAEYKTIHREVAQTKKIALDAEEKATTPLGRPIYPKSTKFETTKILELGSMPVVTSPYIGIQERYNGSQLIVNVPPYNDDVRLLVQRYKLTQVLKEKGLPKPTSPIVSLSGQVTVYANRQRTSTGNVTSDINVSGAELDVIGQLHDWVTGLIAFNYDSSPPTVGFVTRIANSRVFMSKGFLTIGNYNVSPVYVTMGQRFVPFGRYASAMISTPLTADVGSTRARSVNLGYLQTPENGGWYAGIYTFRGDVLVGGNNNINRWGGTAGYQYPFHQGNEVDIGVDAMNEIAEAATMQNNGSTLPFMGFGATAATEVLTRHVGGLDVHTKFIINPISIYAEYTGAIRPFNATDMSFNGQGAKPQAAQLEAVYSFNIKDRPSTLAVSYNHTWDMLALNDPRQRYSGLFSISIWKDTVQAIEYRQDANYNTTDTASGAGSATFSPVTNSSNLLTAQFGVYF